MPFFSAGHHQPQERDEHQAGHEGSLQVETKNHDERWEIPMPELIMEGLMMFHAMGTSCKHGVVYIILQMLQQSMFQDRRVKLVQP